MAVGVALRSGVAHTVWLQDPSALITAVDLYDRADREAKARRR